jgi:hypothetical membrane protein
MRTWTVFSAALAPLFLIAGFMLGAAQQVGFDACEQTISALAAVGAHGRWIMTSGLIGLGLCHLLSALGLRAAHWPGRLTLAAGGLCTLLVAAFPLTPDRTDRAHVVLASAAFVCLAVWPLFAITRKAGAPFALRPLGASLASALLMSLLAWLGWALQQGSYVGLAERVAAAAEALWPLLVVLNVARTERAIRSRS